MLGQKEMGARLRVLRRRAGLTQVQTAEAAGLSERTYAGIERGDVNMRVETLLGICRALQVTPNDILMRESTLEHRLAACTPGQRRTAEELLRVYLESLD